MANKNWGAGSLIGGGADALDAIDGALLSDGDHALVATLTGHYVYVLDADSAATEISPSVIAPDSNAGDKRWLLVDPNIVRQENLLANSGFGVWSNSTLENVRTLPDATTTVVGTTCTSTAHALTAGMLVKDASGTPLVFEVVSITTSDVFEVDRAGATNGQWYEASPGCVASDALGPDGWAKDGTLDLHREHNGSNTKPGSFYAIKLTKGADTTEQLKYDPDQDQRWEARTMSMGAWIKDSTASNARLYMYTGSAYTYSDYHTGGGSYEWIEMTATIESNPVNVHFGVDLQGSTGNISYVSQAMLVFGSSIGEGNYSSPPGEVVWFEDDSNYLNSYANVTVSANAVINLEAESNGAVPKGAKSVIVQLQAVCPAATGRLLGLKASSGDNVVAVGGYNEVASSFFYRTGIVPCDVYGDIYIIRDNTYTNVYVRLAGVGLR